MDIASVAVGKETGAIIDRGRIDLDEMSAKLQDAAGKIAAAAEAAKKLSVRTDSRSDSDTAPRNDAAYRVKFPQNLVLKLKTS